jgi:flagellin-specific chaperone FliS
MVHNQKFESSMFEYCSTQAERAYRLLEDGDYEVGMQYFGHLADILQFLTESRNSQGITNINDFAKSVKTLEELEKDQVYTHFQANGFGQYIPE